MINLKVVKRDGREVEFDKTKISSAILKAMKNGSGIVKEDIAYKIADEIEDFYSKGYYSNSFKKAYIYDIEKEVFNGLIKYNQNLTARAYEGYRSIREFQRENENTIDEDIDKLIDDQNEYWKDENANKNPLLNSTKRDYMAGIVSTDMIKRKILSPQLIQAHNEGLIHIHDADYMIQHMHNCCLINLEDMLQNGTVISETMIEKPHSFSTACNVATQIVAQVASSQYGGQSISLAHLAPFVNVSRKAIRKEVKEFYNEDNKIEQIVNKRLKEEIKKGVQIIQYQLVTLQTTNGQAPFVSVFMYLNEAKNEGEKLDLELIIEETIRQRIQGVKNEDGIWISPAFPKLLYVLQEDNIHEGDRYWYLTELAAKCTSKRLVPDYISEKKMLELKGDVFPVMGCRSSLTSDDFSEKIGNISNAKNYKKGKHKYYGRFNQGVCTINLPDVALSSHKNIDEFWQLLDDRLEMCHKVLQEKHKRLLGTISDVAPILWNHGALARLNKHEKIDKLLYNGYSTISLGYAGLYETVKYMTGCSHSDEGIGTEFGLKIMQFLNNKCSLWKKEENIAYSIYGTPLESVTFKFAKKLQERFGVIEGITDKNYVTNSYHIPVFEEINAFDKLRIESKFQDLSSGGAISYIEIPDLKQNIPALLEVIKYMYENIMYAEINTKSCYCGKCGYTKDIPLVKNDKDKYEWKCPNCGNTDTSIMDIAFRVCGYIGTAKNGGNQGRYGDIHDRVKHLDDHEYEVKT